jgi:DNA-binding NarL/FixJ family response regulator
MAGRLDVYLVEDSPILRRLFAAAITESGAVVVGWSADARKAIADLPTLRPDMVVIDISLASGSGLDVLRALHHFDWARATVKVVLTNHVSAEYRELGRQLGADRFFDKSLETSQAMRFIAGMAASRSRSCGQARERAAEPVHS